MDFWVIWTRISKNHWYAFRWSWILIVIPYLLKFCCFGDPSEREGSSTRLISCFLEANRPLEPMLIYNCVCLLCALGVMGIGERFWYSWSLVHIEWFIIMVKGNEKQLVRILICDMLWIIWTIILIYYWWYIMIVLIWILYW